MNMETWAPVLNYEGIYEVSDLGDVRSVDRYVPRSSGKRGGQNWKGRVLVQGTQRGGYRKVTLCRSGRMETRTVHSLVVEAFLGPRPSPEMQACHNDGDPANNRLSNLRWDTRQSNMADKHLHGTNHQVAKTHCPSGHPYSGENLLWDNGARKCRACVYERNRRRYHQRKEVQA